MVKSVQTKIATRFNLLPSGYTGSQGNPGSSGALGYTGSAGALGYTGSAADGGASIEVSSIEPVGATEGGLWFDSNTGDFNLYYSNAWVTINDSVSSTGYTGSVGENGYTGSAGENGYTGSVGENGYTGSAGENGYTGSAGANGYSGSAGYTGSAGTAPSLENISGNILTTGTITANVPFFLGNVSITANYTIPTGFNAMTPGPVTVANNVVITVPDGSTWTVI